MELKLDLVLAIFADMSPWGTQPDDSFAEKMATKVPAFSATEIHAAIEKASVLQNLVCTSPFQNEPYGEVREKISHYLRTNAPGLSEKIYFHAENRMMFMYIK